MIAAHSKIKRAGGIEPPSLDWKSKVLPLNYARTLHSKYRVKRVEKQEETYKFSNFNSKNFAKSAACVSKSEIDMGSWAGVKGILRLSFKHK